MKVSNIKTLRQKTGAGFLDCKKALQESGDDLEKAALWLRKKGLSEAIKKFGREASEGLIFSYIHGTEGRLAVLVEVNCETDFVARTDQFKDFVKNIALHIAASNPSYVKEEDISEEEKKKELEIIRAQKGEGGSLTKAKGNGSLNSKGQSLKSEQALLKEWISEVTLLKQRYVKDPKMSIEEYLKETIARTGENILIRRFIRWTLGE